MINDCGARVVLTGGGAIAPKIDGVTPIDIDHDTQGEPDGRDWESPVAGEATAYVIYTSGSSGEPKGVLTPHRAIVLLAVNNGYAGFQSSDRVAFASNPAFDASTMEVWATLLNGGAVVIIDQATLLDPQQFGRWLERHAMTVLWLPRFFSTNTPTCSRVVCAPAHSDHRRRCGDPRVAARVLERSPPQRLLNGYGPTETTTFAATYQIREVAPSATSIPIGRPIANTQIYIVDKYREPVPIGATGEILIGGQGVASGYLNRPELTAEQFIASPFVTGESGFTGPAILAGSAPTGRSSFSAAMISR